MIFVARRAGYDHIQPVRPVRAANTKTAELPGPDRTPPPRSSTAPGSLRQFFRRTLKIWDWSYFATTDQYQGARSRPKRWPSRRVFSVPYATNGYRQLRWGPPE